MRSSFDKLISWTGIVVAVVLLFAGGLLVWASSFATQNVHDQLKAQQITMPAAAALTTPAMKAALGQYAGQDLTTGAQAKAYADYYIQAHMNAGLGWQDLLADLRRVHGRHQGRPDRPGHPGPRPAAPDPLHGHHPARHAPERLRLRHPRHHRDVGRDRLLHRLRP